MGVANRVKDVWELLDGGDDDLLALLDHLSKVVGTIGVPDNRAHLGELFDSVADLTVEDTAVSDHDH